MPGIHFAKLHSIDRSQAHQVSRLEGGGLSRANDKNRTARIGPQFKAHMGLHQEGDTVTSINELHATHTSAYFSLLWEQAVSPTLCDMHANMR